MSLVGSRPRKEWQGWEEPGRARASHRKTGATRKRAGRGSMRFGGLRLHRREGANGSCFCEISQRSEGGEILERKGGVDIPFGVSSGTAVDLLLREGSTSGDVSDPVSKLG